MKDVDKHHEKKTLMQSKRKCWANMGKQSKATAGGVRKVKRKEKKHNETKKEEKKRLKQQAKAKADCLERMSPAVPTASFPRAGNVWSASLKQKMQQSAGVSSEIENGLGPHSHQDECWGVGNVQS
jgi:hypothetical protein